MKGKECRLMKRFALILLSLLMVISLTSCTSLLEKAKSIVTGEEISAPPEDFIASKENELYTYDEYVDYICLTAYLGSDTELVLPDTIDGKPVRELGSLFLYECEEITSVVIPASVEVIRESAFYYCDELLSITVPSGVSLIGSRAFAWCLSLKEVVINANITAIPDYCFNRCIALETVTLPASVTKIGVRAFSYCDAAVDITLPDGVTEIGDLAFSGCALLNYVEVPDSAVTLGKDIFSGSESVVVIASESSAAKAYCAENSLRWSTSRSIPAYVPGADGGATDSSSDLSSAESEADGSVE